MNNDPKARNALRGIVGVVLCAAGLWLSLSVRSRQQHTFRVDAGGCRLLTDIVEPINGEPRGYVVLFHGVAANKRIMSYLTEGFAEQGLRVFVPDLPGHGRTEGPFSFDRTEQCGENLVRDLTSHGLLNPERTILAGHSMGGAIALLVASRQPVAGVIALSPAPMNSIPGIPDEAIPYHGFGTLPPHSLIMFGRWEPSLLSNAARALAPAPGDASNKFVPISRATHVGILFDAQAMLTAQTWATGILQIERQQILPPHRGVIGFLLGLAGIVTLAGGFLREILQDKKQLVPLAESVSAAPRLRTIIEFAVIGLAAVALFHYWIPLRVLHLFEGDYFASLLLVVGVVILALQWNFLRTFLRKNSNTSESARPHYRSLLLAGFAALLLAVLFGAWIDLSFYEAWPTAARLVRFIPFVLAVFPYLLAEELVLGPAIPRKTFARLLTSLFLRLVLLLVIVAGILVLHSGEILPVLLATSFALFSLGQAWGMLVVRRVTASPAAAALFGAILLAGFCLVVFPTT
ncbi:MAG: alpha/beta fold hydrolase [Candidatus Acidiferrum sp.]|jgi:pimeloyl-ACP methyl ester carboxylesterase